MLKSFIVIALLISSSGSALADSLHAQIERLEAKWLSAYRRGDGKAEAALVTKHVVVINADGKWIGGGVPYAKSVERYAKVANLSVKISDVESLGDHVAMATGNYVAHVHTGNGKWIEQGYWLRVYTREGDDWKVRASCFSEKEPPTSTITVR